MQRISIRHRYDSICPSIVHANGVANTRLWDFITNQFFMVTGKFNPVCDHGQQQEWTREITVLTWNTGGTEGTFERSCKSLGVPVYKIQGEINNNRPNTRITYPVKIGLTCKVLSQVKTKYVMLVDSYDALLLESPARILDCYKNNYGDNDVVYGAELGHFPKDVPTKEKEENNAKDKYRKFLNSGFCIGKLVDVKDIYEKAQRIGGKWNYDEHGMLTDQASIKMVDDERIKLDYEAKMCLNLYGTKPGELELIYHNNGIRLETV